MLSKLISEKNTKEKTVFIYRHPIMAGMQFMYEKGQTTKNKIHQIGHYDYQITIDSEGQTLNEKTIKKVFY